MSAGALYSLARLSELDQRSRLRGDQKLQKSKLQNGIIIDTQICLKSLYLEIFVAPWAPRPILRFRSILYVIFDYNFEFPTYFIFLKTY